MCVFVYAYVYFPGVKLVKKNKCPFKGRGESGLT